MVPDKDLIDLVEAALKQYIYEQQSYDTVWGELIPKELKALAEKIKRGA
jgi:hypothetical protein